VSRVRENRTHGSRWRREETGTSRHSRAELGASRRPYTPKRTPSRFHHGAVNAERARGALANGSPLGQPPASA